MFTSDIKLNRRYTCKVAFIYLVISLFLVFFGAVYENYSHGVYSYYMIYAFSFPLVGGTFVFSVLGFLKLKIYPNAVSRNLYHSGIATLTIGSLIRGVLDIYGTTNQLSKYYWWIGGILYIVAVVIYIAQLMLINRKTNSNKLKKL